MKSFKLTYVFGLFLLMGLLTSCDSNLKKWQILDKTDVTISSLKDQFGDPDSLNLLDFSIDELSYINNEYLYLDPSNPKFSNNKDSVRQNEKRLIQILENNILKNTRGSVYDIQKKPKVSIIEEFETLTFGGQTPHYHMGDFSKEKQTYINKPDLDNEHQLQFSYEELVSMNFSRKIVCKGCQKLIDLRLILGDYIYLTTKKEWIQSIISKYPDNYRDILTNRRNKPSFRLGGEVSNVVLSNNLPKEGIRYVFHLDKDITSFEGIQKINSYGYVDVVSSQFENPAHKKMGYETPKIYYGDYTEATDESILEIKNLTINSDWIYGDKESPIGAWKFNSDNSFSFSTGVGGGFTKKGYWSINTDGDIYTYTNWSSNGKKLGSKSWLTFISENKLKLNDSETIYNRL